MDNICEVIVLVSVVFWVKLLFVLCSLFLFLGGVCCLFGIFLCDVGDGGDVIIVGSCLFCILFVGGGGGGFGFVGCLFLLIVEFCFESNGEVEVLVLIYFLLF